MHIITYIVILTTHDFKKITREIERMMRMPPASIVAPASMEPASAKRRGPYASEAERSS